MTERVGRQVRAVLALVLTLMALSSAVLVPAAGASATFGTPPQTSATTAQNTSVVLLPIVVNATNSSVAVDLSVTNGTITLASINGLTFCNNGSRPNNTSNVRFRGAQNAVNNALNGITFNPAAGFSGQAFLATKVNDDATNACTDFDNTVDNSASTTITVDAAPSPTPTPTPSPTPTPTPTPSPVTSVTTIAVPPTQTIDQDTTLTFSTGNNNRITVSNPATDASINLIIEANLGGTQLTLPNTAGLIFVSGNGTNTLFITGTQTTINNALNGLLLTPPAGYVGPIGLTLSTTDNPEGAVGLQVNVRARTATQVGSSPNTPVAVGTQVILNSITTRQNASGLSTAPTGTVTFLIDGNVACANAPLSALNGNSTMASASGCVVTSALTVGTHTVTANYSGDASFVPSSNTYQLVITKANTTLTGLGVAPSPLYCDASSVNVSVNLNSTTAATFANGTGTVTVTVKNSNSVVLGTATGTPNPVQGAGTSLNVTAVVPLSGPVAAGPYTFDVTYSGDATFNGSNLSQSIAIAPVNAAVALDISSLTATYGDATVELRANVTGNGNAATINGGTVSFVVKKGNTTLGTVTGTVVNGVAKANFPLSKVNAGNYSVTATYSGTSCYTVNDETSTATGTLKVKQRLLYLKPVDQTRAVGTPNPNPCALELTLGTTLAPGDQLGPNQAVNTVSVVCTYNTPTTRTPAPGIYIIQTAGASSSNYDIRYKSGTLTLTR